MQTHKEVFTQYLKSPRYGGRLQDWQEWLRSRELAQCQVTGLYGVYGTEVGHVDDTDAIISYNDDVVELTYLCEREGVEWTTRHDPFAGIVYSLKHHTGSPQREFSDKPHLDMSAIESAIYWMYKTFRIARG